MRFYDKNNGLSRIYALAFLVVIFGTIGCDKEVKIKGISDTSLLTVICLANPDTTLSVRVFPTRCYGNSYSGAACDLDLEVLAGAGHSVEMRENPNKTWGDFVSDYIPLEGETIHLKVRDKGGIYKTAIASVKVPYRADFDAEFIDGVLSREIPLTYRCTLKDRPGKNYYRITAAVRTTIPSATDSARSIRSSIYRSGTLEFLDDSFLPYGEKFSSMFSDDLFDGETVTFDVALNRYAVLSGTEESEVLLNLQTLSEETYRYLQSWNPDFTTTMDIYAEPNYVYTNVDGGTGLVGAMADSKVCNLFNPDKLHLRWVNRDMTKKFEYNYNLRWTDRGCDFFFETGCDDWEVSMIDVTLGHDGFFVHPGLRYDGDRTFDCDYFRAYVTAPRSLTFTMKQNDSSFARNFHIVFKSGNFKQAEYLSQHEKIK